MVKRIGEKTAVGPECPNYTEKYQWACEKCGVIRLSRHLIADHEKQCKSTKFPFGTRKKFEKSE